MGSESVDSAKDEAFASLEEENSVFLIKKKIEKDRVKNDFLIEKNIKKILLLCIMFLICAFTSFLIIYLIYLWFPQFSPEANIGKIEQVILLVLQGFFASIVTIFVSNYLKKTN